MAADRYNRQIKLRGFGPEAQQKLKNSKVLVVGAGGLGVPVLQYLAGMGVGTIGIIDGDVIKSDNLHRQVLYSEDDLGQQKTTVAVRRLAKLNSEITLIPYASFLTVQNALDVINNYNVVVDACDNFGTRYLINDACVILNKPFVYGAVQQFEGQVSVFNYHNGPTYRCLFPNQPSPTEIPDCNVAGVLGIAPGIIGCNQALQAIKVITGVGCTLSGYLQVYDFLRNEERKIKLKANPQSKNITRLQNGYGIAVCSNATSITVEELFRLFTADEPVLLLDVREPKEYAVEHLTFAMPFPLSSIKENMASLPKDRQLITICEIGGRSAKAADLIAEALPGVLVSNVEGGMETWFDELGDQLVVYPEKADA